MSWDHDKRRGYHHGNLREALVQAALRLIGEKGPAGFTFAEAARAAGVSPAAPYRHFRDRDDLMADIARRGYESLDEALRAAWNDGQPTAREGLVRTGRAYLDFAKAEPAAYVAMFESGVPMQCDAGLQRASDAAFATLSACCEAVLAGMNLPRRPPTMMVALHIWSMSHGIASLFVRADAARRPLPMSPEDLLEAGVLVYLDGLRHAGA